MPAEPGFLPRKIVLDEADWSFQENAKGNRPKKYCSLRGARVEGLADATGWFWKGTDGKYPHEFWSEILACRLGSEMGVPVSRTHLGIYDGSPGSLAESLLAPGEELVEAADIMAGLDEAYERRGKGERQTVELARRAIAAVLGEADPQPFHRMVVFDAWIGNQDRHHENRGFAKVSDGRHRFADIFDNGSSLLRELSSDDNLSKKVGTPLLREGYIARSSSEIRWEAGRKIPHLDLFRLCAASEPGFRDTAASMLASGMERIERAVHEIAAFARDFPDARRYLARRARGTPCETSGKVDVTTTDIRCRMDIEALRLAWRPANAGERLVVGTSIREGDTYSFRYDGPDLEKAVQLGFQGYPGMSVDRTTIWNGRSMEAFRARLPQPKRPDREHLLGLWGVPPDESDPFVLLGATGGRLVTDAFEFLPVLHPVAGTRFPTPVAGFRY